MFHRTKITSLDGKPLIHIHMFTKNETRRTNTLVAALLDIIFCCIKRASSIQQAKLNTSILLSAKMALIYH